MSFNAVTSALCLLCIAGAVGVLLGRISIYNVSIGAGGVLFSSLILGHFGFSLNREVTEFLRDTGLAIFVYTVGIQIGPNFFQSFKKDGLKLNILAAIIVSSGLFSAVAIMFITGLDTAKVAGIMSGAVTNTPGLGAAQQLISQADGNLQRSDICGITYAVAYPFGIFGIIFALILLKKIFKVDFEEEKSYFAENIKIKFESAKEEQTDIFALFTGILAGVLLGAIAFKLPKVPVPLKLGAAGGPLLVALFLGRLQKTGPLRWTLPLSANLTLRELGIVIFLACVGLRSGGKFAESIIHGEGINWIFWGSLITFIPIFLVGFISLKFLKLRFFQVCGLLSGAMTDPPALSFAEKFCASEAPALTFTTVYALTMFLRIIYAQILIIFFL